MGYLRFSNISKRTLTLPALSLQAMPYPNEHLPGHTTPSAKNHIRHRVSSFQKLWSGLYYPPFSHFFIGRGGCRLHIAGSWTFMHSCSCFLVLCCYF
ncbi:hypothetical protein PM082_009866 [Marasmius tenuissimus]|nr:hypothetical protein PM082_009866 [Marasmius tenuissimus]